MHCGPEQPKTQNGPLTCPFARTAHSFTSSALLSSFTRSAALTHSLISLTPSLMGQCMIGWLFILFFFLFLPSLVLSIIQARFFAQSLARAGREHGMDFKNIHEDGFYENHYWDGFYDNVRDCEALLNAVNQHFLATVIHVCLMTSSLLRRIPSLYAKLVFQLQVKKGVDLVVIMFPRRDEKYSYFKKAGETKLGIMTQCVLSKQVNCIVLHRGHSRTNGTKMAPSKIEKKINFSDFVHFWCGGTSWNEIHSYPFFFCSRTHILGFTGVQNFGVFEGCLH